MGSLIHLKEKNFNGLEVGFGPLKVVAFGPKQTFNLHLMVPIAVLAVPNYQSSKQPLPVTFL